MHFLRSIPFWACFGLIITVLGVAVGWAMILCHKTWDDLFERFERATDEDVYP